MPKLHVTVLWEKKHIAAIVVAAITNMCRQFINSIVIAIRVVSGRNCLILMVKHSTPTTLNPPLLILFAAD